MDGAKGILVNFTSSPDIKMIEIHEAMEYIIKHANPEVFIKYGQVFEESAGDELKITVIATGFPSTRGELSGDLAKLRGMGRGRGRLRTQGGKTQRRAERGGDETLAGEDVLRLAQYLTTTRARARSADHR